MMYIATSLFLVSSTRSYKDKIFNNASGSDYPGAAYPGEVCDEEFINHPDDDLADLGPESSGVLWHISRPQAVLASGLRSWSFGDDALS